MIYRQRGDHKFYVFFSKDTVRRASELFLIKGNQSNATLEHEMEASGLHVVESWIKEGKDKSDKYNLDAPDGSWIISMKVTDDKLWEEIKEGKRYKGFSIEGFFSQRANIKRDSTNQEMEAILESEAADVVDNIKELLKENKVELESYNDYPEAVTNNAKRGRELNKKVNNKCATNIGKIRSADLASKRKLNVSTIKRMYSYLSRAAEYYDEGDNEACGTISYLLWGGKAGLRWSESKLKELGEINLSSMVVNDDFAIIDDRLAYSTQEKAEKVAKELACEGFHIHEFKDKKWFMPCETHELKK
jgi:hypothetical protein